LSKLRFAAALGVALSITNTALAGDPGTFYGIQLTIGERYEVVPVQSYAYDSLTDAAVAGLTTFSQSHPMPIGTLFGDNLYGAASVNALTGYALAEFSATVQEPGVNPARGSADVQVVESFQIDGAAASVAKVRFLVGFHAHGNMVQDASQDTSSSVALEIDSADQTVLIASQAAGGRLCVGESYFGTHCRTTYFEGDARNETMLAADQFNLSDSFVLEASIPTGVPLSLGFYVNANAECTPSWGPECASSSYADANLDLLSVSDGTLVTQHGWLVPEPAAELEAIVALGMLTLIARRRG
jgi:hypothetical protein